MHPKRDDGARNEFIEKVTNIAREELVFIDESGIEDNACPLYGWSLKGSRCYGKRAFRHRRRISMIAGLCNGQLIAPILFEGTCDSDVFLSYVEQVLVKELKPGQTVVMDNIGFHKTQTVRALLESAGCKVLFLPNYSTDLKSIEKYLFKLKHTIRKIAYLFLDFFEAVSFVLHKFTT